MTVRVALIVALVTVVVVVAKCGGDGDGPVATTTAAAEHRDGDPAVWDRIETGTDCAALAAEWDQAMDNAEARQQSGIHDRLTTLSLDYAAAASKRMRDIGCP